MNTPKDKKNAPAGEGYHQRPKRRKEKLIRLDDLIPKGNVVGGGREANLMIAREILFRELFKFASAFRQSDLDLEIEQLQIEGSSPLVSNTLEQLRLGKQYGVIVLAVQHKNGVMQFNPPADTSIQAGDVLIAMGERPKLKLLEQEIARSA